MATNSRMRYFVRLSSNLKPVLGSLVARKTQPKDGRWVDITECLDTCGCLPTTTTTTSTSTTSTSTTSTSTTTSSTTTTTTTLP